MNSKETYLTCQKNWMLQEALHENVFGNQHHWTDRMELHHIGFEFAKHVNGEKSTQKNEKRTKRKRKE